MLKVIKCSDNPTGYTFKELCNSLEGKDEFSKYRTTKFIRKEEGRIRENVRRGVVKKEEEKWN